MFREPLDVSIMPIGNDTINRGIHERFSIKSVVLSILMMLTTVYQTFSSCMIRPRATVRWSFKGSML